MRSPTANYLASGFVGISGVQVSTILIQIPWTSIEAMIRIGVQAAIGIVTIYNLIHRRKQTKDRKKNDSKTIQDRHVD